MSAPEEIDFLFSCAGDADWRVRSEALLGVGKIAGRRKVPADVRDGARSRLTEYLGDSDAFVRRKAAEGLGSIGDPASVRILVERLKELSSAATAEELKERGHLVMVLQRVTGLVLTTRVADFERWLKYREDGS